MTPEERVAILEFQVWHYFSVHFVPGYSDQEPGLGSEMLEGPWSHGHVVVVKCHCCGGDPAPPQIPLTPETVPTQGTAAPIVLNPHEAKHMPQENCHNSDFWAMHQNPVGVWYWMWFGDKNLTWGHGTTSLLQVSTSQETILDLESDVTCIDVTVENLLFEQSLQDQRILTLEQGTLQILLDIQSKKAYFRLTFLVHNMYSYLAWGQNSQIHIKWWENVHNWQMHFLHPQKTGKKNHKQTFLQFTKYCPIHSYTKLAKLMFVLFQTFRQPHWLWTSG